MVSTSKKRLTQAQVAELVGVDHSCIVRWEKGEDNPLVVHMPKIIAFLGYTPLEAPSDTLEKLRYHRITRGLIYEQLGKLMGKDPEQIRDWLVGRKKPKEVSLAYIETFLSDGT